MRTNSPARTAPSSIFASAKSGFFRKAAKQQRKQRRSTVCRRIGQPGQRQRRKVVQKMKQHTDIQIAAEIHERREHDAGEERIRQPCKIGMHQGKQRGAQPHTASARIEQKSEHTSAQEQLLKGGWHKAGKDQRTEKAAPPGGSRLPRAAEAQNETCDKREQRAPRDKQTERAGIFDFGISPLLCGDAAERRIPPDKACRGEAAERAERARRRRQAERADEINRKPGEHCPPRVSSE